MKVHIDKWRAVATWHWTAALEDELCGICRAPFDGTCPNCKYPGDGCPLVLGNNCTHNFHIHCILTWLEQELSKGLCPMCRQTFTAKFIEGVGSKAELESLNALVKHHQTHREMATDEFERYEQ